MSGTMKISVKARMAKSANVERDINVVDFDGYIPTGRVLDVIHRIAVGMSDSSAGRAFSITGPYGSGKSSFAVFLHALFDDPKSERFLKAKAILAKSDPDLAKTWVRARSDFDHKNREISRAFVTAKTEPLAQTLGRAISVMNKSRRHSPSTQDVKELLSVVKQSAENAPLVILIDEFGKNLEAFGDSKSEGDPYLLQLIAELSQGGTALPIILITMQHLAFDEYVIDAGSTQRREWAKVQGRFHDVGFIDSPEQSYLLIASVFNRHDKILQTKVDTWYKQNSRNLNALGFQEVLESAKKSYPLHPATLIALPDLCSRFGQNERTLFSFLAGSEPGALPTLIKSLESEGLPFVGLDAIYDYFVGSASSFIGASHSASRWIEVETRVRDASGLRQAELVLLKSIGVLNLLSAGGALRASRSLLKRLWSDGKLQGNFESALEVLNARGFVTYREFADEFRIWSGSDFNLRAAIEAERRTLSEAGIEELLSGVTDLDPVVAGRHSQKTGVLRVFPRRIVGSVVDPKFVQELDLTYDGIILLAQNKLPDFSKISSLRPVIIARGSSKVDLRDAAIEVEAHQRVLTGLKEKSTDWVAMHEVGERLAHAKQELDSLLNEYWNPNSSKWYVLGHSGEFVDIPRFRNISALVSWVSDQTYTSTPRVANEMISRRELTSQGAKARRTLVNAMFENVEQEFFGIEGYGPERAIYESIIKNSKFHLAKKKSNEWQLHDPSLTGWKDVWSTLTKQLALAQSRRITLTELTEPLSLPPFGLKNGLLGLLTSLLIKQRYSDIALYEYGTLVLAVDDAVIERMLRNPDVFSVRNTGVSTGSRYATIQALRSRLLMKENSEPTSFLEVARALFRELRGLEPFTQQTEHHISESAKALRRAFKEAVEPDLLIFEAIPEALGLPAIAANSGNRTQLEAENFANRFVDVLLELKDTYPQLVKRIERALGESLSLGTSSTVFRERVRGLSLNLLDSILQPKLKTFAYALSREDLDDQAWLENIAMVVSEGLPPRMWSDENEAKFALQIAELGSNFRRLQALLYERLASSAEGFESRRITITWPDGKEVSESVALSHQELSVMSETIGESVAKLVEIFGTDYEARKALSAWLWMEEPKSISAVDLGPTDREDVVND